MILELVEFDMPKGYTREQLAEDGRQVIAKWQANEELVRKHFAIEVTGDDENRNVAGVYIWPSIEAAQRAHDEEWRQSIVVKRSGCAPTIRYFDLFLLIDNESGKVSEFPEAAK